MSGGVAQLRDEVTNSQAAAEYSPELQLIPPGLTEAGAHRRGHRRPGLSVMSFHYTPHCCIASLHVLIVPS